MQEFLAPHPEGLKAIDLKELIVDRYPDFKPYTVGVKFASTTRQYPDLFTRAREKGRGVFYALNREHEPTSSALALRLLYLLISVTKK